MLSMFSMQEEESLSRQQVKLENTAYLLFNAVYSSTLVTSFIDSREIFVAY
jgi:hypothetical protein